MSGMYFLSFITLLGIDNIFSVKWKCILCAGTTCLISNCILCPIDAKSLCLYRNLGKCMGNGQFSLYMIPDVSFCNNIARSSSKSVTEIYLHKSYKITLLTLCNYIKSSSSLPYHRTSFIGHFETSSPRQTIRRVFNFDALAF